MKNRFVNMGYNYTDAKGSLVRTVCRAYMPNGEAMIAYVNVDAGGYASEVFLMNEEQFKVKYSV